MTDTFNTNVQFLAQVIQDEVPDSNLGLGIVSGTANNLGLTDAGGSGQLFWNTGNFTIGSSNSWWVGTNGTQFMMNNERFQADARANVPGVDTRFSVGVSSSFYPIPGTPYLYIVNAMGGPGAGFYLIAIMYEVNTTAEDGTNLIYKKGALFGLDADHPNGKSGNIASGPCLSSVFNSVTGNLFIMFNIRNEFIDASPFYCELDVDPTHIAVWIGTPTTPETWGPTFFDFAQGRFNPLQQNFFSMPMTIGDSRPYLFFYVDQWAWNFIQANPGYHPDYVHFTGPGVYKFSFPTSYFPDPQNTNYLQGIGGGLSGPVAGFDLPDEGLNLDGSPITYTPVLNANEYWGTYSFLYHGTRYVSMTRSYQSPDDLNHAGTGTYIRTRIFKWDGSSATQVYEYQGSLFNVVDLPKSNETAGDAPSVRFVQTFFMDDTIYYFWSEPIVTVGTGGAAHGNDTQVVGSLVALTHTEPTGFKFFFSQIKDPAYVDWHSSGLDYQFDSFLLTWFMGTPNDGLWMEAPWIVTYLDNNDNNPSCLMTPQWEWTDATLLFKKGPTVDIYHVRDEQTVSDFRNRVRGKGRALQLRFESSPGQPFNLLGWSLNNDSNAQP